MWFRLRRTGQAVGKSGRSGCVEAFGGVIDFQLGFTNVNIPDDRAESFRDKVDAGLYPFVLALSGEGPHLGTIVDTISTEVPRPKSPAPNPLVPYQDAVKMGISPKALAGLRKQTQDVDGKVKTFLYRADLEKLHKKGKGV